jgi:hypothetical protein
MLAFMRLIDVDYKLLFTCPICSQLPHDQLILTVDGKEMGMQRTQARPYEAPVDHSVVQQSQV